MSHPDQWDDAAILAARPPRNQVSPWQPYAYLVEPERTAAGVIEPVATIFLSNRECPFRCLMCDLWMNTLEERVPLGAIPAQIDYALRRLLPARHIKLYNSGNFFDPQAIPPDDFAAIADRVAPFETVIVENHPKLCGPVCLQMRDRIAGQLEVALGLETIHPQVLPRLNKRMTLDDFDRACEYLLTRDVQLRAFVLLKPPFLDEQAGVDWCLRSIEHAFDVGVRVCAVIATRGGNGVMEQLAQRGDFSPPRLASLEQVVATAVAWNRGRVLADLWEVERLAECPRCSPQRIERLRRINLEQSLVDPVDCNCGEPAP